MKASKKWMFRGIIAIALFVIFFVGRSFDASTGTRHFILTSQGAQHFRKGLDVSGGTRLVYKISYDKYEKVYTNASELAAVKKTIEDIILKNIDSRISKLGVSDYKSYVQNLDNQHYIVVEIGGIANLDQAKEIIGKTLELEFKLQKKGTPNQATIAARAQMAQSLYNKVAATPTQMAKLTDGRGSENVFYNHFTGALIDQLPEVYKANEKLLATLPLGQLSSLFAGKYASITSQSGATQTSTDLLGSTMIRVLDRQSITLSGKQVTVYDVEDIFVQDRETRESATDGNRILNGAYFKFASTSATEVGEPVVVINLDDQGKDLFCTISQNNIGNPMAIFVGGNLLTAPTIQSKICGGTAQINGGFTAESAKQLSTAMNEGTLPAPLILMQEEKISPTLGVNALSAAMRAGIIGFIAIALLIRVMYGIRKMILTSFVLLGFLAVLFAMLKMFDFAFSLSGIAAIILALGMGVDANILIYERLNEELAEGKGLSSGIDTAKARSRPAIRDGQVSTGLIAFLLFTMGTNIFKGFGAMMIITMFLTLFFNVPFTKIMLHLFYDKKNK